MGNTHTQTMSRPQPERSFKTNAIPPRLPMPEHNELEKRFIKVLNSMDLPPDKAKLLRGYDDDKKWELVCDQERFSAKEPPEYYLDKLRVFLDPAGNRKSRTLKNLSQTTSSQTLRDLEISLRTNHIEWVRLFLSEEHNGLDILVDYLSTTQFIMSVLQNEYSSNNRLTEINGKSTALKHSTTLALERQYGSLQPNQSMRLQKRISMYSRPSHSKITFGDATDDVHLCIMCLRAIMNHQYGFNLVFGHKQAINCIALSLKHKSYRTKTLVLELLAAVCLVSGGHDMILSAFDNFKVVCAETHRFETLMSYFRNTEEFHIDFMVACMQFINIVVHSVEQVNFRVHLQHEFYLLGLDEFLEKLRSTESDRLPVQVNAYLDNTIDVQSLLEDSDTKTAALERVAELEEALSYANDKAQEIEEAALSKVVEYQKMLNDVMSERDMFKQLCEQKDAELAGRPANLSGAGVDILKQGQPGSPLAGESSLVPAPPPPPIAPPPPPTFNVAPPPPPLANFGGGPPGGPPPPPPPGMGMAIPGVSALPIKKNIQPKYRLPVLNWVAMKPNQVKGTLFSELDDEKLYSVIDFNSFEEMFKLGSLTLADVDIDATLSSKTATMRRPETVSLLDPNRMRNVAITRRKIENSDEEIVRAINSLDLKTLFLERVEILLRIVPNEQEIKAFKEYERDRKPTALLSDEDRFMMCLNKVERLGQKLHIMSFIGNFFDTYHHLQPQLNAIIAASISLKNSPKIRKILEIILAFGNYMNSSKRGAVYGFKLQSLDMLCDAKSTDKKMTLLHFIVKTVHEKFPDVAQFDSELKYVEKAATVSLENIITDITELEKGMEMTRKEYEARKDRDPPVILRDFLLNSEDKIKKLKADAKSAQEAYSSVVEIFGENAKTMVPTSFFPLFVRFVRAYKQAEIDFENWRKLEEAQMTIRMSLKESKKTPKQTQEAVVGELKQKQRQIKEKKVLNRDEVYHGALEDILLDLKNEPYRRADGVRRSQRRHGDNQLRAGTSHVI